MSVLKVRLFPAVYWLVNLVVSDKHGTKIYRDLSALEETLHGKRMR